MRSTWSCSSCAGLLFFALFGREILASHAGRQWKDVHRIAKAQVTAHPARRDEGSCPAEHTLCAASFNGGCCPSQYACAVDSCYATTAGPTTACGLAGFYACAPVNGEAGCCPVGYICSKRDCIPPAGVTYTNTQCPTDLYLCPASVNYGCCMSGMGCAANVCYSTAPVTTTYIQTFTTTSDEETITKTQTTITVITPTPPPGIPDDTGIAAKFIPSSVPKVAAGPSNDSGGGLSGGAIGGIIAGVVILLVVVVVAAFLIIRRLKRVENIMESKRGSSSGKKSRSQSQAQMEQYGRQLHSDMDDMSVDPLMVGSHATNNNSASVTPQPGADANRGRSDSTGFTPSPNMFNFTEERSRHASPDSNAGYFDIPPGAQNTPGLQQQPMQAARIRGSTDSAGTQHRGYAYHHWRQQSNASELSADGSDNGVHSPLVAGGGIQELDGSGGFVELPSEQNHGFGYVPGNVSGGTGPRSRSSSTTSARGHARRRSDSLQAQGQGQATATATGGLGLTPLDETAEMHGHYGRPDQQAGQTAAGLEVHWDVSPGFHPQGPQGT